jgi:GT2 family glycosyltransferase
VDVVLVNCDSTRFLLRSVASLLEHAGPFVSRVVVVDSAGRTDDGAPLASPPPGVTLVRAPRELGFAAACNLGAAQGDAPTILFLNPDTMVLPETVPGLLAALEQHHGAALVGPRQHPDRSRTMTISPLPGTSLLGDAAHALYDRGWLGERSLHFLRWRAELLCGAEPVRVGGLSGAALAVRRGVFQALGGFDERSVPHAAEADLRLRAGDRGVAVLYLPHVGVVHFIDESARPDRPAPQDAAAAGRETCFARRPSRIVRAASRVAAAAATHLPLRAHRADRAVPHEPDGPFRFPASPRGRGVFELARSPLFDNCLTAFFRGDAFRLPDDVLSHLPAEPCFARLAEETGPGHWEERALFRVQRRTTVSRPVTAGAPA